MRKNLSLKRNEKVIQGLIGSLFGSDLPDSEGPNAQDVSKQKLYYKC